MSMFNKVSKTFQWGSHTVTMETGEVARQSSGAVMLDMDGTVVLATVVAKTEGKAGQDFFPLTVDYLEKAYAAGLHDLPAICQSLNADCVPAPEGKAWTPDLFAAEMKRLGGN